MSDLPAKHSAADRSASGEAASPNGAPARVDFRGPWAAEEADAIKHAAERCTLEPTWVASKHAFPSFTLCVAMHPSVDTALTAATATALAEEIHAAHGSAGARDRAGEPPPVFQLVYRSKAAATLESAQIDTLLRQAQAKNERLGITGVLLHANGHFLQVLEGEEEAVRGLYATIEDDPRHRALEVLAETRVVQRVFPDWSMGLENLEDAPADTQTPAVTSFLEDGELQTEDDLLPVVARALEQFKDVAHVPGGRGDASASDGSAGHRLLIVEDNATTQHLVEVMFDDGPHAIDVAGSVDEALFKAEEHDYDAFVLDINLGERRTGIEVLHAIRRMPRHEGVPAIACTAYALQDQQALFREAGFSGVVTKPITKGHLIKGIEDALTDPAPADSSSDDLYVDVHLPPLPTTIPQLLSLIARGNAEETDYEQLIRILTRDQVLATWLIRVANSASFKLRSEVESVEKAIQYLGFRPVCNLLLGKLLTERFHTFDTEQQKHIYTHVMRLGIGAAYLARALAEHVDHPHPEIAYSGVLLSQLGRLMLLDEKRGEYADLWFDGEAFMGPPPIGQETLFVSASYVSVGMKVGRRSDFSDQILHLIRYHQRPSDTPATGDKLLALIVAMGLEIYAAVMEDPDRDLLPVLLDAHPLDGIAEITGFERRPLMTATQEYVQDARNFTDDVFGD
jgi:HD-like signal output (HDOD) protein